MRESRCLAVVAAAVFSAVASHGQVTLTEWTGPAGLTAIHQPDELGFLLSYHFRFCSQLC